MAWFDFDSGLVPILELRFNSVLKSPQAGDGVVQPTLVVLIVEDEFLIMEMVKGALAEGGFESEGVGSGDEAVSLLQTGHDRYRALVTDINLRGTVTGWEVAKLARELSPDIPVVYMTGAAGNQGPRMECRIVSCCKSRSRPPRS